MAKITDLSLEVALILFDYFDTNTLLKCRQVSKRLKYLVEQVRLTSLCVHNEEQLILNHFDCKMTDIQSFFYTDDSFINCNYFRTSNSDFFHANIMKTLLCKLKKLYIRRAPLEKENIFNLDQNINQFKNLEQLQISRLKVRKNYSLSLPKLKILTINYIYSTTHHKFSINCPSLFAFKTWDKTHAFVFEHPDSITHISLNYANAGDNLSVFENLECVTYYNECRGHVYLPDFKVLTKFKEIHFKKEKKSVIDQVLEQKISNNLNFQIYYGGLNVETSEEAEAYSKTINAGDKNNDISQFIALNYAKTSNSIDYYHEIDYQILTSTLGGIPDKFLNKFRDILKVKVSHSEQGTDQAMFIDFIRSNKRLRVLDLDVSFDQTFYDNLRFYSPYLNRLDIKETKRIDVDFLGCLKHLQIFNINQLVSIDKIRKFFDILDKLYTFTVKRNEISLAFKGNYFSNEDGLECFVKVNGKEVLFENLESMMKFIRNLERRDEEPMDVS